MSQILSDRDFSFRSPEAISAARDERGIARVPSLARAAKRRPHRNFKSLFSEVAAHSWNRLREAQLRKALLCGVFFVRHLRAVAPLLRPKPGSNLQRLLKARPEIFEMVYGPYIAASWNAPTRIARVIDHCETVSRIGGIVDFVPGQRVNLISLAAITRNIV